MGCNPVLAVVAGVAVGGYGILPGFVAGYIVGFVAPFLEKKLPEGLNLIVGALAIAPLARIIAIAVDPVVNSTLLNIGRMISAGVGTVSNYHGIPARWYYEDDLYLTT